MISLSAFFIFLGAASLPATYIFLCSRWIEPEDRLAGEATPRAKKPQPVPAPILVRQAA